MGTGMGTGMGIGMGTRTARGKGRVPHPASVQVDGVEVAAGVEVLQLLATVHLLQPQGGLVGVATGLQEQGQQEAGGLH